MKLTVTTEVEIPDEHTATVLCTAVEGGIRYWCSRMDRLPYKDERTGPDVTIYAGTPHEYTHTPTKLVTDLDEPVEFEVEWDYPDPPPQTATKVDDRREEGTRHVFYKLDRAAIVAGWSLLAKKYPTTFGRMIDPKSGDYDASDADVFLQLCLFGEVIFG